MFILIPAPSFAGPFVLLPDLRRLFVLSSHQPLRRHPRTRRRRDLYTGNKRDFAVDTGSLVPLDRKVPSLISKARRFPTLSPSSLDLRLFP